MAVIDFSYADDVVLITRSKFLNTFSELLQSALKVVSVWTETNGLGVNATKTELVLFTNRHRSLNSQTVPNTCE
uniref:Uncharacterized protein n=1 Tax=Megaselia scalaris TaxID=36166 RepID=T1GUG6_MEGSC